LFQKDGTSLGVISIYGADMFIGTDDAGLTFNNAADLIAPVNPTTGATRDNAIDLGASNARFKDLYLSNRLKLSAGGGIEFGQATTSASGASASSTLLDAYEEGTFTPRFQQGLTSAGYSTQTGVYTKIGRQVICSIVLRANSGSENGDHIYIGGLPFIARNATAFMEGAFFTLNGGFWTSDTNTSWLIRSNETNLAFYRQNDAGAIVGTNSSIANNLDADVRLIVLYTTA
jgi:hypothetical protein